MEVGAELGELGSAPVWGRTEASIHPESTVGLNKGKPPIFGFIISMGRGMLGCREQGW